MNRNSDPLTPRRIVYAAIGFFGTIAAGVIIALIVGEGRFANLNPTPIQWIAVAALVVLPFNVAFIVVRWEHFVELLKTWGRSLMARIWWIRANWQLVLALLLSACAVVAGLLWIPRALWALILVPLGLVLANVLFTLWLHSEKEKGAEIFRDDFSSTLDNWQKDGDWSIVSHNGERVLRVTDSGVGGIATPCLTWVNYVFEFDTRIEKKYSGWIIRAQNLGNYVMLQCRLDQILPCFRAGGQHDLTWTHRNAIPLRQSLALNTWYHVRIKVRGTQVSITMEGGNIKGKMRITHLPPLEHPGGIVSYSEGSMGFREAQDECALFRNVQVKRLQ
jgi:hypothetical protein